MARVSYSIKGVDTVKCEACGRCVQVCPQGNFEMVDYKGRIVAHFNQTGECDHCARCVTSCDSGAVRVEPDGGTLVSVDPEKCTACEKCVLVCPGLFEVVVEGTRVFARVKEGADKSEASKCAFACPEGAIKTGR
jgi:Fe-S-cluster-containing hydrogenase component 2